MKSCQKFLSTSLLALFASAAFAQTPPAPGFSVLANAAVTCTAGTGGGITGNVGTFLAAPTGAITETPAGCITGTKVLGATAAFDEFLDSYTALKAVPCTRTLTGTLAGVTLTVPGVYCVWHADAPRAGERDLDFQGRGRPRDDPCDRRTHGHQL
jgi:hypothetical protein